MFMDTYSLTIHDPRSGNVMKKPMISRLRKNYVGTRGKGEASAGTNHLGFRCVKPASVASR